MEKNTIFILDIYSQAYHLVNEYMLSDFCSNFNAPLDSYLAFRLRDRIEFDDMELNGEQIYYVFKIGDDGISNAEVFHKELPQQYIAQIKENNLKLIVFPKIMTLDLKKYTS